MLKNLIFPAACVALFTAPIVGGPFDPSKVGADAKWVVHLDADVFRKSTIGQHVIESFIRPKVEENEQIKKLNLSINLTNISGITAYGHAFEKKGEGVLILSTTADVKKDLDTLVGMAALSEKEEKDIVMLQDKPFHIYSYKEEVFLAPNVGNSLVIAKSREMLERGREVVLGKEKSLVKAESFNDFPALPERPFFVAMAEGFNDAAGIPPQANVLRETKGGRLVLGEKGENLFLNLVFKAKDDAASTKIQQVLQGIVALVSLSQPDKDITELANGSRIASAGRNVSVDLQVPAGKAIRKITEKHGDGGSAKKSRRARDKQQDQTGEEPDEASEPAVRQEKN